MWKRWNKNDKKSDFSVPATNTQKQTVCGSQTSPSQATPAGRIFKPRCCSKPRSMAACQIVEETAAVRACTTNCHHVIAVSISCCQGIGQMEYISTFLPKILQQCHLTRKVHFSFIMNGTKNCQP